MRKARGLILVAAVLAAMGLTTSTGHAKATEGRPGSYAVVMIDAKDASIACFTNHLCLFTDVDQKTLMFAWPAGGYHPDFTKILCSPALGCRTNNDFNDEASSWHNNTNMTYCVSWGINGGNPDNTMPPGSMGNFTTTGWNDEASSLGFIGCP